MFPHWLAWLGSATGRTCEMVTQNRDMCMWVSERFSGPAQPKRVIARKKHAQSGRNMCRSCRHRFCFTPNGIRDGPHSYVCKVRVCFFSWDMCHVVVTLANTHHISAVRWLHRHTLSAGYVCWSKIGGAVCHWDDNRVCGTTHAHICRSNSRLRGLLPLTLMVLWRVTYGYRTDKVWSAISSIWKSSDENSMKFTNISIFSTFAHVFTWNSTRSSRIPFGVVLGVESWCIESLFMIWVGTDVGFGGSAVEKVMIFVFLTNSAIFGYSLALTSGSQCAAYSGWADMLGTWRYFWEKVPARWFFYVFPCIHTCKVQQNVHFQQYLNEFLFVSKKVFLLRNYRVFSIAFVTGFMEIRLSFVEIWVCKVRKVCFFSNTNISTNTYSRTLIFFDETQSIERT